MGGGGVGTGDVVVPNFFVIFDDISIAWCCFGVGVRFVVVVVVVGPLLRC
jgi:hypothetical protein